jgi:hypothetical protein
MYGFLQVNAEQVNAEPQHAETVIGGEMPSGPDIHNEALWLASFRDSGDDHDL